ncbi:hypothetical protein FNYG_02509 [Fusarium nygamai]|uniref:Uncharacterized protein n=1 Tax=Gibberella nygamai TaxID=42673 RepID=A0A2K0WNH7_GIBNY|nr:hypothetical protein FNYG_02509 [Fusarium nygamai]
MEKFVEEQHGTTDDIVIEDFLASLKVLQPLLQGQAERQYLSRLETLALLSKTSPRDALMEMVFCYALTNKMTDEDYSSFTDPSNYRAQILLAHFLVLNHMLEECFLSTSSRWFAFSKQISRSWIMNIGSRLPDGLQRYLMWPLGQAMDLSV